MTTNDVKDAVIGMGSTGGGIVASYYDVLSPPLRFASLVVGLIIGLIILYKHIRHWNDKP